MPPNQMVRWVLSPGNNEEKVARGLDPQSSLEDLRARLSDTHGLLVQCNAATKQIDGHKQLSMVQNFGCLKDLGELKDQVVLPNEAKSFLGGRMHISASSAGLANGCIFSVRTRNAFSFYDRVWGAGIRVDTAAGSYEVVPTGRAMAWVGSPGCKFDLVQSTDSVAASRRSPLTR